MESNCIRFTPTSPSPTTKRLDTSSRILLLMLPQCIFTARVHNVDWQRVTTTFWHQIHAYFSHSRKGVYISHSKNMANLKPYRDKGEQEGCTALMTVIFHPSTKWETPRTSKGNQTANVQSHEKPEQQSDEVQQEVSTIPQVVIRRTVNDNQRKQQYCCGIFGKVGGKACGRTFEGVAVLMPLLFVGQICNKNSTPGKPSITISM